jgi:threonine dehydrogenase-like Zn-dependent dehydrogenase
MRAFVITGPREAAVQDVPAPVGRPGEVVVDVTRAGICGTDIEFYTGEMAYLHTARESFPVRIGHEWTGVVRETGPGVDPAWLGKRVVGDTMIGCGTCRRCATGRHHVCADLAEIGCSLGRAGALAERLAIPARQLLVLPDTVDDAMGAMVEPGGNAMRAVRAAGVEPGERLLVLGAGTIGLLAAMLARSQGVEVHLMGRSARSLAFARALGFEQAWSSDGLPDLAWDGVIDASNAPDLPARAVELVEPGRRVALIGLAGEPSTVDTRRVALRDVTVVGLLGASAGLAGAIDAFATGAVDPRPLIAATVPLDALADVLAGNRPDGASAGPKFQVEI